MMTNCNVKHIIPGATMLKGWEAAGAAVVGRGHVKAGMPCQDATFTYSEAGAWAIALADGAGSAAKSELGANLLTHYIAQRFCRDFDAVLACEDGAALKQQLLQDCREQLQGLAVTSECNLKDLASTLLVVAVKDDRFLLLHIGDGVIGMLKEGELKVLSAPENGEYANSTYFVTSAAALETMKLAQGNAKDVEGFVLMSDGSQACLYNKRERRLAKAIKVLLEDFPLLEMSEATRKLETALEEVIKTRTTDDCSLALLYRIAKVVVVRRIRTRARMLKRAKQLVQGKL